LFPAQVGGIGFEDPGQLLVVIFGGRIIRQAFLNPVERVANLR
jgi:hypothetical protein